MGTYQASKLNIKNRKACLLCSLCICVNRCGALTINMFSYKESLHRGVQYNKVAIFIVAEGTSCIPVYLKHMYPDTQVGVTVL